MTVEHGIQTSSDLDFQSTSAEQLPVVIVRSRRVRLPANQHGPGKNGSQHAHGSSPDSSPTTNATRSNTLTLKS